MKTEIPDHRFVYSVCIIAWTLACGSPLHAQNYGASWPQWRGPTRDGKVTGDGWPASLQGDHLRPQWRVELGPSFSGPVVVGDQVFVTETKDEKDEIVRALDRKTGKEIWKAGWEGAMTVLPIGSSMGSWIRATPAHDGEQLYVAGMRDVLVCLDAASGAERWRADFHERYGTPIPELGFVCSPLVVGEAVYVQAADSVIRVNKATGQSEWRSMIREELGHGAYSSPDFGTLHGQAQLLVATIPRIAGLDPDTGRVLWNRQLDSQVLGCILAPIIYREGIFTSTRASHTGYYPIAVERGEFNITDGWKNKLIAYMSSPMVIGDYAYMHLQNRRLACLDLRSGEDRWITEQRFGGYCSMISREDRILALTNEGTLLLIRATPEKFDLLDERKVSEEETWAHLAIFGNQVFIRELHAIAAYVWR